MKNILNISDESLTKEKETLLLGTGGASAKTEEILNHLGLDEHIKDVTEKKGKIIEIQKLKDEYKDITTVEQLRKFCIKFNYLYQPLSSYKGPLPEKLTSIIATLDLNWQSKAVTDSIYILAPLEYFQEQSSDKQIKIRRKKELEQVLLLQKVSDDRHNSVTVFKTIEEVGKILKHKRIFRSFLYNSPRIQHAIGNTIIGFVILFLLVCLMRYTAWSDGVTTSYTVLISAILSLFFIVILLLDADKDNIIGIAEDEFTYYHRHKDAYKYNYLFPEFYFTDKTRKPLKRKYYIFPAFVMWLFLLGVALYGKTFEAKDKKIGEVWTESCNLGDDTTEVNTYIKKSTFNIDKVSTTKIKK